MIELRPYQQEAIDSLYQYFGEMSGNPLIVMPTGTGKSVVIASFIHGIFASWPDSRILCLTHVKELIQQNFGALLRLWPDAPAGIYSAGLNKRDIKAQILFAGIQSIYKHAFRVQQCDLVLIDEAHLLSNSDTGMYRIFMSQLTEINPTLKIIGFTATPYRMDVGLLHKGPDRLFTDIAYEVKILKMIEEGYLTPVVSKSTATKLDVTGVHKRGGEFIAKELQAAVDTDEINRAAVQEIVTKGADRGSWLVFCSGVEHAEHVRDCIREHGITCEAVLGDTPPAARARYLEEFKSGKLRAITNFGVLTTGFDAPGTDLIALLRPTESVGLYVQMLGRGTRLANGKEDCLVLDFAGNVARHGPLDMVDGDKDVGKGDGTAPTKTCPKCESIIFSGCRECPDCGFAFPAPELKIDTKADERAILSTQFVPEWIDVTDVKYFRHPGRDGKPDTMRADHWCGMVRHSEWLCFEHTGYPRDKALNWWIRRLNMTRDGRPVLPATVEQALSGAHALKKPTQIQVKQSGKYTEIVAARFA